MSTQPYFPPIGPTFHQPYVPSALRSADQPYVPLISPLFHQPYVPSALRSTDQPYVPLIHQPSVLLALSSISPMFRHQRYISSAICSIRDMFHQEYVPSALCSIRDIFHQRCVPSTRCSLGEHGAEGTVVAEGTWCRGTEGLRKRLL